ncbi:MAG: hypothetical protein ACR2MP_19405 [Streptosporangiaceae bacterium]
MSFVSRGTRFRQRHITDGPILDMSPEDKRKIMRLVQRGQAVTDDRLVSQAIAYANFRERVSLVFALIFLMFTALEAAAALFSSFGRIFYAFIFVAFLAITILWFWTAWRCRKAAQTMTPSAHGLDSRDHLEY